MGHPLLSLLPQPVQPTPIPMHMILLSVPWICKAFVPAIFPCPFRFVNSCHSSRSFPQIHLPWAIWCPQFSGKALITVVILSLWHPWYPKHSRCLTNTSFSFSFLLHHLGLHTRLVLPEGMPVILPAILHCRLVNWNFEFIKQSVNLG